MLFSVFPRSSYSPRFTVLIFAGGGGASLFVIGGGAASEPAFGAPVCFAAVSAPGIADGVFSDEFSPVAAALGVGF